MDNSLSANENFVMDCNTLLSTFVMIIIMIALFVFYLLGW